EVLRKVNDGESVQQGADLTLVELSNKLRATGLDAEQMNEFLERAMPSATPDTLRQMREATAGQWLRTILTCLPLVMLTDGGTNYHGILSFLQLCWIHMLRPFSLLAEDADSTRVLHEGWVLYHRICSWRSSPNQEEAAAIEAEFDRVFDLQRCSPDSPDSRVQHQVRLTL